MVREANSLSHIKWMCRYHIVSIPKCRQETVFNQHRDSLGEISRTLCKYKGVEVTEGHLTPDHVYMLVSIPPKISVSSFMRYLKGKSVLMTFGKYANLKYRFGSKYFWAEGRYVSTVELNEQTITKYIREQEQHDIAMDGLSVKKYEGPSKRR